MGQLAWQPTFRGAVGEGELKPPYPHRPDGSIVVVASKGEGGRSGELVVVLGFFEELKKPVPMTR